MTAVDFLVPLNGVRAPWFPDPALRAVFSGTPYVMRCVAAIGPADGSRVVLVETANPRQLAGKMSRACGEALTVRQALWTRGRTAVAVLASAHDLVTKAGHADPTAWLPLSPRLLDALLVQAAERIGVPAMLHRDFHAHALGIETEKLRARLVKGGADPAKVARYRYVSAFEEPPVDRSPWTPSPGPVKRRGPGFARTQAMARAYKSGASLREVAAEFGVSHQRVSQLLDAGTAIARRPRGRKPEPPIV